MRDTRKVQAPEALHDLMRDHVVVQCWLILHLRRVAKASDSVPASYAVTSELETFSTQSLK